VEVFPSNIIAQTYNFRKEVMFDLGAESRENMEKPPEVKF
jgi:LemA protein